MFREKMQKKPDTLLMDCMELPHGKWLRFTGSTPTHVENTGRSAYIDLL